MYENSYRKEVKMQKLKDILKESNIKQADIANILDIKSLSTINLKLNGKAEFTTKEARQLKDYINQRNNSNYTIEELFE
jgi:plasmid maintenance system antidote protein VapI